MIRNVQVLLPAGLVALALALVTCARPAPEAGGKDPSARLLAHTDAMIRLLEENRADPEKAMRELTAYRERHGDELRRLKQALGDLMQQDPRKAAAASAAYGMKSAQLDTITRELEARARAHRAP